MKKKRRRRGSRDAHEILEELAARAPQWIASGRLRGRWIGLVPGKDQMIFWRKVGRAELLPPVVWDDPVPEDGGGPALSTFSPEVLPELM